MHLKTWLGAGLLTLAGAASAHLAGGSYGGNTYERIDVSDGRIARIGSWRDDNFEDGYADLWAATIAGRRYAFIGQHQNPAIVSGIEVVDVTEPDYMVKRGIWRDNSSPGAFNVKDVQVKNAGWGFAASDDGGGAFVIDFRTPASPGTLHRIYPGRNCNATAGIECDFNVHDVWVNGDYLYLMHWKSADVRIFRWAVNGVPQPPAFVRTLTVKYGTDYYGTHDLSVKNGRMMLSCTMKLVKSGNVYDMAADQGANGGRTFLFDLSGSIKAGSSASNPLEITSIASGEGTHSNWMTDDAKYIYSAREAEGAGIKIFKITTGTTMSEIAGILPAAAGVTDPMAVPHNPVVKGNYLYVTWYTEGLKVFDITNPELPSLIGSYDVHKGPIIETPNTAPNKDINCYRAIWGVDPFFGESSILISDIETGLHSLFLTPNIVPGIIVPAVID